MVTMKTLTNRRQRIRWALILISFFLFPVTLYYFSPYLIVVGAAEGVISGSAILFAGLVLSGLFFGRRYATYRLHQLWPVILRRQPDSVSAQGSHCGH